LKTSVFKKPNSVLTETRRNPMNSQRQLKVVFGILVLSLMVLGSFNVVDTALSSSSMSRGTDSIVGVDAYNGYKVSNSMTTLYADASGYGHIYYRTDQYDGYKIPVSTGDEVEIYWYWYGSSSGIDLYYYNTGGNRESLVYNKFSYTKTMVADGNGYLYFAVDSDKTYDRGDYYLSVTKLSGPAPDTEAPTCTITYPTEGATVSGTITVTATASDNVGVEYVECGSSKDYTAPYQWTLDTTEYENGAYTITCTAYDAAGNSASDTNGFTIDNGVAPPPDNELTSGETVYSSLDSGNEMWTIQVGTGVDTMRSVLNCGNADFDLYGRLGAEPTTSTYDWRGYTYGGEDVTFDFPGAGTWYIMVQVYSGSGAYDLTVTLSTAAPPEPWGSGGKYAIIVGISDYASISDLSYCDEDATDIYNFLSGQGYECRVYGDGHIADYPRYDGKATESVVRAAIQGLAAHAQPGDTVIFTTSGHGSGDGNGNSFLCMWDCSGSAGCYYDYELEADFSLFAAGVNIMVFVDHCYSGGLGPELLSAHGSIYITTTCTEDGYGWDDGSHQNGAWTYEYFEKYWVGNPSWSAEYVFDQASASYPHTGGDAAMEFDGFAGSFYLN
jgi:hypothetical protein